MQALDGLGNGGEGEDPENVVRYEKSLVQQISRYWIQEISRKIRIQIQKILRGRRSRYWKIQKML
eukprot:9503674-Pyramimonas_sp.AAC.1